MSKKNIIFGLIIITLILLVGFLIVRPVSSPSLPVGLPNPASVNCEEVGGTLDIRTGPDGGQVGYCTLPDKTVCEEWALLRNECTPKDNLPVACTMDAKICPDGSAVGRVGPKCEFAPCPVVNKTN